MLYGRRETISFWLPRGSRGAQNPVFQWCPEHLYIIQLCTLYCIIVYRYLHIMVAPRASVVENQNSYHATASYPRPTWNMLYYTYITDIIPYKRVRRRSYESVVWAVADCFRDGNRTDKRYAANRRHIIFILIV